MLALSVRSWPGAAQRNIADLIINRAWLTISVAGAPQTPLQDGVPDGWTPSIWGGAGRAVHALDATQAHSGQQSATIRRTNSSGFAVFGQAIALPAGREMICGVYSRGSTAFIQIIVGDKTIGYAELPASQSWTLTETRFASPPGSSGVPATLYLGLGPAIGQTWFDDAYCRDSADAANNLLTNAGFEQDGVSEDPLAWWSSHVTFGYRDQAALKWAAQTVSAAPVRSGADIARQNIVDLLQGQPGLVRQRMPAVLSGCTTQEANPGIWLGLEDTVMSQAGSAAFERLAQLAQSLMPGCPQPYAALGKLYLASSGYQKASQMFGAAVLRSQPGPQRGLSAFAQGNLEVTVLGNWDQAIEALTAAEQNPGWEDAPWYYGAAAIDLGQAWQASGHCAEARAAYTRVLNCPACVARWPDARAALMTLPDCPL